MWAVPTPPPCPTTPTARGAVHTTKVNGIFCPVHFGGRRSAGGSTSLFPPSHLQPKTHVCSPPHHHIIPPPFSNYIYNPLGLITGTGTYISAPPTCNPPPPLQNKLEFINARPTFGGVRQGGGGGSAGQLLAGRVGSSDGGGVRRAPGGEGPAGTLLGRTRGGGRK